MPVIRVVFLWHMHQPYYKDLVTGEYRLPWVRLHALKDYYGMVKLLDEFPAVHQTFNLVPSLIAQIQDYVSGKAQDPFFDITVRPAGELNPQEKRFALQYLFQANAANMIGRYPRYRELYQQFRSVGENPEKAERFFQAGDYTDLQVLSQIAWFDESFLEDKEVAGLIRKARGYSADDQRLVAAKQKEFLSRVLPAYKAAEEKGSIEISASPYYHPILPLLCDTDTGRASAPGLALPQNRFRRPEDAEEQLRRGLDLHEQVFGRRPRGAWPSEGSVSDEVLSLGHKAGLTWMATDEGVLGRSQGKYFARDGEGRLSEEAAERLYRVYRWQQGPASMHLVFRDHSLSDLIGFVYSGMGAKEAAQHLIQRLKDCAKPVLQKKKDAVVPIILDGENAWEFYPQSGREFLRRVYDLIARDPEMEATTVSEAIARTASFGELSSLVPGSWINANFNVWIGAPEDNRSWDYLHEAREFYGEAAPRASDAARQLAYEELLIAEGSDWNWWYGPEHRSANDREFDELYRKHLSNVYQALGSTPPEHLAQPIAAGVARPYFAPQTAYIHPRIDGSTAGYFDWIGAAMYTADRHSGAMHGKQFLLDAIYAGVDDASLYARLDFADLPQEAFKVMVAIDVESPQQPTPLRWRLEAEVEKTLKSWELSEVEPERIVIRSEIPQQGALRVSLSKRFEFQVPLAELRAQKGTALHLRFSLWRNGLPLDALPLEGSMRIPVCTEQEMENSIYNYSSS